MDDASNLRPLSIFSGYMLAAAVLTASCARIIHRGLSRPQQRPWPRRTQAVVLFSVLAALSLSTTWYHMFRFFERSYVEWRATPAGLAFDDGTVHLGPWLRDTKLFRQAWATVLDSPSRAWWSLQIFGFCANWSVMLAEQQRARGIPRLWLFMLLAQIVAVSFASNLFFLAVAAYAEDGGDAASKDKAKGTKGTKGTKGSKDAAENPCPSMWYDVIIAVSGALGIASHSAVDEPYFLPLLLVPHILGFAPLLLNRVITARAGSASLGWPRLATYITSAAVLLAWASLGLAAEEGRRPIWWHLLYDHPAVSSVGWDVVCSTVSYGAWYLLHADLRKWARST